VDGHDIDPAAASRHDYGLRCRLYPAENGLQRTPPDAWITDVLRAAGPSPSAFDGTHLT
jgi:hypothetical protein